MLADPDLAERYRARAEEIAAAFAAEDPRFENGTIDLCIDEKGEISLIEVNPLLNFGFYALDVRPVVDAILAVAVEKGPDPKQAPVFVKSTASSEGEPWQPFDAAAVSGI